MNEQPAQYLMQNRRLTLLLNILTVLVVIVCAGLIFLSITGYSTVKLSLPSNATIHINGHTVSDKSIRMLPGSYQVIVSSPTIRPYQGTLSVGLFQTIIYRPSLEQRDPETIASSLLGGSGQSGALQFGLVQWFDNDTWVVGLIGPSNTCLAAHFDVSQNQWVIGYYNGGGYPDALTLLPSSVAAYVEQLEAQNAQG